MLPADITRCCDGLCPERWACRRWVDRFALAGPDSRWVLHADTLHAPDDCGECSNRIPMEAV